MDQKQVFLYASFNKQCKSLYLWWDYCQVQTFKQAEAESISVTRFFVSGMDYISSEQNKPSPFGGGEQILDWVPTF